MDSDKTTKVSRKLLKEQLSGTASSPDFISTLNLPKKYKIKKVIGQGGMKTILLVHDSDSGRDVALAVMNDPSNSRLRSRFQNEARITTQLEHPNIVPLHELALHVDPPYFTMKYICGDNLSTILEKLSEGDSEYQARYPLQKLLEIFLKICDAVAFAHSKGIIHLDLKPENIEVGDFGEVLVIDWGMAKQHAENDDSFEEETDRFQFDKKDLTLDGVVKGSPSFMAPEQAAGKNSRRGYRTDIYAMGAILYSIMTYHPPVDGDTAEEIIKNARRGRIVSARKYLLPGEKIPMALEFVAYKAMATSPTQRYSSISELRADIEAFMKGYATKAERADFLTQFFLFLKRKFLYIKIIAGTILLTLLISALAFSYMHWKWARLSSTAASPTGSRFPRTESRASHIPATPVPEWRLFFEEAFSDNYLTERWHIYSASDVSGREVMNDELMQRSPEGLDVNTTSFARLQLMERIPFGTMKVQYDVTWHGGRDSSLNLRLTSCDDSEQYYFLIGTHHNSRAEIRYGKDRKVIDSIPYSLESLERYQVECLMIQHPKKTILQINLNGKKLLSADLNKDVPQIRNYQLDLVVLDSSATYHNMKIFTPSSPELVDILQVANSQLDKGNYKSAIDIYEDIEFSSSSPQRQTRAAQGRQLAKRLSFYQTMLPEWQQMLNAAYPESRCVLSITPHGIRLSMTGSEIRNLTPLKNLPLNELEILQSSITDLSPLTGMNLHSLTIANSQISELHPLMNMPLQELDLFHNPIRDIQALSGIPLRRLNLDFTEVGSLQPLSGNTELLHLSFRNARVQDLSPLKELRKLRTLNCSGNRITSLAPISSIFLEDLSAAENSISDLSPLKGMPLKQLNLAYNQISDLKSLSSLRMLKKLDLSFNRIFDLTPLESLDLETLRADKNQIIKITVLSAMNSLQRLSLRENRILDLSPLGSMMQLHTLNVDYNELTLLSQIAKMKNLRKFSFEGNQVGIFNQYLPNLEYLNCSSNPIETLVFAKETPPAVLIAQNLPINRLQELIRLVPAKLLVPDATWLSADQIQSLLPKIVPGAKPTYEMLLAYKENEPHKMHRNLPIFRKKTYFLIPTMVTYAEARKIALRLGLSLPSFDSRYNCESLARYFGSGFWLEIDTEHAMYSDLPKEFRVAPQKLNHFYGWFYSPDSSAPLAYADSETRKFPLLLCK